MEDSNPLTRPPNPTQPEPPDDRLRRAPSQGIGSIAKDLGSRGTRWMVLGAGVGAIGVYLFQLVGTRSLGDIGYAPIGALWTIQYLIVSVVLYPVETYVTHRTFLRRAGSGEPDPLGRIWVWISASAGSVTLLTWLLRQQLFRGLGDLSAVAGLTTLTFGAFVIVRGKLAGSERFKAYGLVTATESAVRAILAVGVVLTATSTRALGWTIPVGAFAAAALWLGLRRRPPRTQVLDHVMEPLGARRFLLVTVAANAALQLLLVGGPLVLAFIGGTPKEISILFVTLMAARAPLLFLFSGFLSRLLPAFLLLASTDDGRALRRTASWIGIGTLVIAVPGGLAAAAVGGQLLGFVFGSAFTPPALMAAGATVGVLLAAGSMILNHVLIAQGSPASSLVVWVLALLVAIASLALVGDAPTERVVAAFVIAEAVALAGLVAAAHR